MKHFTIEEWADFARNLGSEDKRQSMQSHLGAGCRQCEQVVGLWKRVYEAAQRESLYEPSQTAVRTVKAMYAIHGRPQKKANAVASLLFDSFMAPVQAGVRSVAVDVRQLLYGRDDYRVDLRLEPQIDSEKISIVGQLLNSADPSATLNAIPVTLLKARKVVGETGTNRFGEFHFDAVLEENLVLRIAIPQGPEFSVPLIDPVASQDSDTEVTDSNKVRSALRAGHKSTRKKG